MDSRPGLLPKVAPRFVSILAGLLVVAATGRLAGGDEPLLPKGSLQRLESIAKEAAAKGRDAEMIELLDVLRRLGDEPAQLAKVRGECAKSLAGASAPAAGPAVAALARDLHALASELLKQLPKLEE